MDAKSILSRLYDEVEEVGDEMTGGTGYLSFRRKLRVRRGGATTNVFLKLSDPTRQDLGELKEISDHFCPRECLFYGCLAPLLERTAAQFGLGSTGLPVVHHELVLPTGTLLVMEDLEEAGFQLIPAVMNVADARCVLGGMARLQATFWLTKARLGPLANGLLGTESPLADAFGAIGTSGLRFEDFIESGCKILRRDITKYLKCERREAIIKAYLDGLLEKALRVMRENREERQVIGVTHSDLWYNNCMIRRDTNGEPLESRLIDWQMFGIGNLANDLGTILLYSLDNATVIDEFLPSVNFYYESIRSLYESNLDAKFPVTLEQVQRQAIQSLHWGNALFAVGSEYLAEFTCPENVLSNMADLIEHFSL